MSRSRCRAGPPRASAGQGYRFPSIAERFIQTNIGAIFIYPNPDLIPEKGNSYEIGITQNFKVRSWLGFADVAIFRNEYTNMIEFSFAQWRPSGPLNGNGFKSVNVGNTRIDGYEISFGGGGKLYHDWNLSLTGGYTTIDPVQLTFDSSYIAKVGVSNYLGSDSTNVLKYRNRHLFRLDAELTWKKFSFGWTARYSSRMENIDNIFVNGLLDFAFPPGLGIAHYRDANPGGDWLHDARLAYNISSSWRASFIVKNVANNIFMQRPADMQPPRTFTLQLMLSL